MPAVSMFHTIQRMATVVVRIAGWRGKYKRKKQKLEHVEGCESCGGSYLRAGQKLTEVSQEVISFIWKDKTLYDVVSRFAGIKRSEEVYPCFLALIELFENKENRDL